MGGRGLGQAAAAMRVLAVSDLHVDYPCNLAWVKNLSATDYRDDIIIVAGDVTHKMSLLEETLVALKAKFRDVFFTPGNHDLWVDSSSPSSSPSASTSFSKLNDLLDLCERIGVVTRAKKIEGTPVWIAPIFSWYHASWDREADWPGALPPRKVMADFRACKWPDHLSPHDDSLAREFDRLNESLQDLGNLETVLDLERDSAFECDPICITFSHFVPRNELIPEKSRLFYKVRATYPPTPTVAFAFSLFRRAATRDPASEPPACVSKAGRLV